MKARPSRRSWTRSIWCWGRFIAVGERNYYLVCFLDEYSRYIVHHELLTGMDGVTVSIAAQAALETLPTDEEGKRFRKSNPPIPSPCRRGSVCQQDRRWC